MKNCQISIWNFGVFSVGGFGPTRPKRRPHAARPIAEWSLGTDFLKIHTALLCFAWPSSTVLFQKKSTENDNPNDPPTFSFRGCRSTDLAFAEARRDPHWALGMEGVEPPTLWFVAIDSNPLSYIPDGHVFTAGHLAQLGASGQP